MTSNQPSAIGPASGRPSDRHLTGHRAAIGPGLVVGQAIGPAIELSLTLSSSHTPALQSALNKVIYFSPWPMYFEPCLLAHNPGRSLLTLSTWSLALAPGPWPLYPWPWPLAFGPRTLSQACGPSWSIVLGPWPSTTRFWPLVSGPSPLFLGPLALTLGLGPLALPHGPGPGLWPWP
jgi:hypothetical protein